MIKIGDAFLFKQLFQAADLAAVYQQVFFAISGFRAAASTISRTDTGGTAHLVFAGQVQGFGQFKRDYSHIAGSGTGIDTGGSIIGDAVTQVRTTSTGTSAFILCQFSSPC